MFDQHRESDDERDDQQDRASLHGLKTGLLVVGIAMAEGAATLMLRSSIDITPLIVIAVAGVVFTAVGARERLRS